MPVASSCRRIAARSVSAAVALGVIPAIGFSQPTSHADSWPTRAASVARVDVAGTITDINATTLAQLLGNVAGVQVTSGGASGMGYRIRIRGQSSLALGNDPLVVVDGVRLYSETTFATVNVPSRLDDIDIDDIASIDVFEGPAAAARFGTGAANGVISINTRRGAPGRLRARVYTEQGLIDDATDYPDLHAAWGRRAGSTSTSICALASVAARTCVIDSVSHGNVLDTDSLTPYGTGYRSRYGALATGGNTHVQYALSGKLERETGVTRMPAFEVARLTAARGAPVPARQRRPSGYDRNDVAAHVTAQPVSFIDIDVSGSLFAGSTRQTPDDGQSNGLNVNALGGPWNLGTRAPNGAPLHGYASAPIGEILSQRVAQNVHRLGAVASVRINPSHWIDVRALGGLDHILQRDSTVVRAGDTPNLSTATGVASANIATLSASTGQISATTQFGIGTWLEVSASLGGEWLREHDSTDARLVTGGAQTSSTTTFGETTIASYLASASIGVRDALFIAGGVRRDSVTFIGPLAPVSYPWVNASWLVHRKQPRAGGVVDTLRLRSAYGESGQLPQRALGADALLTLTSNLATLTPERTAEFEVGTEVSMFGAMSRFQFTHYSKLTRDVFVPGTVAPSLGGNGISMARGMRVRNSGTTLSADQRIARSRTLSMSVGAALSTNRNRITAVPDGLPPIVTGNRSTQKSVRGYPLFGYWGRTYRFDDANRDGIIVQSELTVSDTTEYLGSSLPTRELVLLPHVALLDNRLRLDAQFDSKWGYRKFNNTLRHQCQNSLACRGAMDASASLDEQAAAVAAQQGVLGGMIVDGAFTRLREVSATLDLPRAWARGVRASRASVAITGRNVALFTKYAGADPEAVENVLDTGVDEFFSTPPRRVWSLRLNVVF